MTIFFTSDIHFFHSNIIKYCKRPFQNVKEMNTTIINNINSKVKEDDELYIIGDYAFSDSKGIEETRNQITCKNISIIPGNHDNVNLLNRYFKIRSPLFELRVVDPDTNQKQLIVLCHYALRVWNKSHHGSWHLYGHSHGTLSDDPTSLSFDIGVDSWDYYPLSYDEVKSQMLLKHYKPINHHE